MGRGREREKNFGGSCSRIMHGRSTWYHIGLCIPIIQCRDEARRVFTDQATYIAGRGGGGCTQFVHGHSRMIIDSLTSLLCRDGARRVFTNQRQIYCLHQARSAVRCSASRMKGELHPSKNRKRLRMQRFGDIISMLLSMLIHVVIRTSAPCAYFLAYG